MKIFNIQLKNIIRILIIVFITVLSLIIINKSTSSLEQNTLIMTEENFTQILKAVHDSPYEYENYTVKMSGYVFRNKDFKENQFVVARNMYIDENDLRIVGFLCEYDSAKELKNNEWIECEGKIYIGDYYGVMPIVKIEICF